MRSVIASIFLCLLMLQAIPVLNFFSDKGGVFYSSIDEEKPGDAKEKKGSKEYLAMETEITISLPINTSYHPAIDNDYAAPNLALLTPPPDTLI